MSTSNEAVFTAVTKNPAVRDRMIRAFHRHAHEHGYLWEPVPGCGCEERIDQLLADWDDEAVPPCDDCGRRDGTHNMEVEH